MSEPFGIEPLRRTAELSGDDPSAVVEVDVTNGLDRHVHAAVEVRGEPPMESSWVVVEPESFSLEANESRRLKVRIAPPSGTAAGEYPFSLRVYDVDRPADAFARSPSITATVHAAKVEERRGAPGWLVPTLAALLGGAALSVLALVERDPGEVAVTTEVERIDPDTGEMERPSLNNLPVQLLPVDRDQILDSLTDTPRPQMPEELQARRHSMLLAQAEEREAESEWLEQRERLEQISAEMEQYAPGEFAYQELFAQFERAEAELQAAEERRNENLREFARLHDEISEELEDFRLRLEAWEEDTAHADYGQILANRLSELGREIVVDTTDADGRVRLQGDPGEWWVYTRYRLTHDELYWNVPVILERGQAVELRLTEENAEVRPIF